MKRGCGINSQNERLIEELKKIDGEGSMTRRLEKECWTTPWYSTFGKNMWATSKRL